MDSLVDCDIDCVKDVCHSRHVGSDVTVAILGQGTSWAVAVTQALLFLCSLHCGVVDRVDNVRPFAMRCVNHQPQLPKQPQGRSPNSQGAKQKLKNNGVSQKPEQPRRKAEAGQPRREPEARTTKA